MNLDFEILAKDNIRTLKVPPAFYQKPLAIFLVGLPCSGKTTLVNKLASQFPLTVLAEENMRAFLAPRATIFQRGTSEVFQLAVATIKCLLKQGKACIYDSNIKTKRERVLLRTAVEDSGGTYLLIFLDCPKKICYERLKKQNLAVGRGEAKGFILDKDFFEYEAASTQIPTSDETHLTYFSGEKENFELIAAAVEKQLQLE